MTRAKACVRAAYRRARDVKALCRIFEAPGGFGAALVVIMCTVSCRGTPRASRAQCERLRDRYIDLELSSQTAAGAMTPETRAFLRGRLAMDALSGPQAAKIDERCEARVSEAAYKCAVNASTLTAWQRCLE